MNINKNTDFFNDHTEVDQDDENEEVNIWLSLFLLFIWVFTLFVV